MASQTITTRFKTEGAQKVVKDTDRIGKAQTRLGQASASSGRQFSAQAAGLGGVVGVYAAAAANIFALTAAFTALNRAAQFETIIRGTQQLSAAVGTSANSVIKRLQDITGGQLSIVQAAEAANLALSAGFNTDQIEQLGQVAFKASRTLGRSLPDAIERVFRGTIKLEPELLDELGIFTRLDPAVEKYAASLNKSTTTLTAFERRQAFANGVIGDGTAAFSDVIISTEDATASFQRLAAQFADLAIKFGNIIANILAPFADFLGQNLGNKLLLLGAIGALVFNQLGASIGGFVTTGLTKLSQGLVNATERLTTFGRTAKALAPEFQAAGQAFVGGGALPGAGRAAGAEIKRVFAEGTVSTQQAQVFARDLKDLKQNELNLQKTLNEEKKIAGKLTESQQKQYDQSVQRLGAIEQSQKVVNQRLKAAGPFASALASGLNLAATAMRNLAAAANAVLAVLGPIFAIIGIIQLVGSVFGVDVLGGITDFFKNLTKDSRDAEKGLKDFGAAAASVSAGPLADLREELGLTRSEFAGVVEEAIKLREQGGYDFGAFGPDLLDLQTSLKVLEADLERLTAQKEAGTGTFFGLLDKDKQIEDTKKEIQALEVAISDLQLPTGEAGLAITRLAEAGEIEIEQLQKAFARGILNINKDTNDLQLTFETFSQTVLESGESIDSLTEEAKALSATYATAALKVQEFYENFEGGRLSADRAAKDFGVINNVVNDLRAQIDDLPDGPFKAEFLEFINNSLDGTVSRAEELNDRFQTLDKFAQQLRKTFSGELGLADSAIFTGDVGLFGDIAKNDSERLLNLSEVVNSVFTEAAKIRSDFEQASIRGGGVFDREKLEADEKKIFEIRDILIKGYLGSIIKITQEQEKLNQSLEKQKKISQSTIEVQRANLQVTKANTALTTAQQKNRINAAERERDFILQNRDITEQGISLRQIENSALEATLNTQKELLSLKGQELKLSQDLAKTQIEIGFAAAEGRDAQALARAQGALQTAEMRGISTRRELVQLRLNVAEVEFRNANNAFDRQEALAQVEAQNARENIAQRSMMIEQERVIAEARIINELEILRAQEQARVKQAKIEQQALNDEEGLIELRRNAASASQTAAKKSAEAAKLQRDLALKQQIAELELVKQQAAVFSGFISNFGSLIEGLAEIASVLGGDVGFDFEASDISADVDANIAALQQLLTDSSTVYSIQVLSAKEARKATEAQIQADKILIDINKQKTEEVESSLVRIFEARQDSLLDELDATNLTSQAKQKLLSQELAQTEANLVLQLEKVGIERTAAEEIVRIARDRAAYEISEQRRIDAAYAASKGIVMNYVENGLMELNTALIEGDLTFKNIAKGFRDMLGSMLREIQSAVFRQTIAAPIAEFVGGLFAAGGRVHLAGGGSMKRDRVAAMLEPGEYVIRKEAAKKLGMSKLQELNAGVSDDPIARIIAYAYGSKVKSKAAGGGLGFGNPADIGYGGTGIGPTGVGPSTSPGGSFSSGAGESITSFAPSSSIGPTSVTQGFFANATDTGFGSLVSTTPFGPPTVTDSIIGKLGGSTYMNTPQITEGKMNQLNADAQQAQQMAEEAASLISEGYTDSQISAFQTMQNIASEIGAPGDFGPEEAPSLLSEVQNNQKSGQGLQQAYNNAFKGAPQQFIESLAPTTPLQGLSLIAGTGLIGETAQAISQISGALGFASDVAEGENAIGQALGLGKASGGKIMRMAGGGSVNSRDRVPALLEPGEFVIRRPAAKAIGGAALNQMNATGKAPSISVNMTNQGAPKDVAVGAPKINGDKIILDIITRDLRNNGSIKKTLRKGK